MGTNWVQVALLLNLNLWKSFGIYPIIWYFLSRMICNLDQALLKFIFVDKSIKYASVWGFNLWPDRLVNVTVFEVFLFVLCSCIPRFFDTQTLVMKGFNQKLWIFINVLGHPKSRWNSHHFLLRDMKRTSLYICNHTMSVIPVNV